MPEAAVNFGAFYLHDCSEHINLDELESLFPTTADKVGEVHGMYSEVDKLMQDASGNAKKIAQKLRGVWEDCLEDMPRNVEGADDDVDCFCTLLYDYKKKLQAATERLEAADAAETHVRMLNPVSDRIHVLFEAKRGRVAAARDRATRKLGRLSEPDAQREADGVPVPVQVMRKSKDMLEEEADAKKAEFLSEVLRPQYVAFQNRATELHEMEAMGGERPNSTAEAEEVQQLMDPAVLMEIHVIYVGALRIVAKPILSIPEPRVPKALKLLLGADWQQQLEPTRRQRLRALSTMFHPDKVTSLLTPDILQEAHMEDPRQVCEVQIVINDACGYLKEYFETLEEGEKALAMANRRWNEAVAKSEKEKGAKEQAAKESLKNEKEKCASEALILWRTALRVLSDPKHEHFVTLGDVRMQMAKACELLGKMLECQVYMLSAMRMTAKGVSECRFTAPQELEKYRSQWIEQRSFLKRLRDRQQENSPSADEDGSDLALAVHTDISVIQSQMVDSLCANNLDCQCELEELEQATRNFDVKSALMLGAAIDMLCLDCLRKQQAKIDEAMCRMAENAAAATWTLGLRAAGLRATGTHVGTAALTAGVVVEVGEVGGMLRAAVAGCTELVRMAHPFGAVLVAATALAAGTFWLVGRLFRLSSQCKLAADEDSKLRARQKVVIEIMQDADKKRRSSRASAGLDFLEALSVDLSECMQTKKAQSNCTPLFKRGDKILEFPSKNFANTGELIEDVEGTIKFLTQDIGICAAGVLQYLVHAGEVIAGRQVQGLCTGVSITQDQALTAAQQLISILLHESGGMTREHKHNGANLKLVPNPGGALLKKAQKEDRAEKQLEELQALVADGVAEIMPGTKHEDVVSFLYQGWFSVYIANAPNCDTIRHRNLVVDMTVRSVTVTDADGSERAIEATLPKIQEAVASQDYTSIKIIARRGSRTMVSNFMKMCFCSFSRVKGPMELEVIRLREILKINLAMVYLISMPMPGRGGEKNVHEILAEWLLLEVISTINGEGLCDVELLERVEALKDFYLVFVGRPLELKDE